MKKNAWMRTVAALLLATVLLFTTQPLITQGAYLEGDDRFELTLESKKGLQGDYLLTRDGVTGKHMLLNLYLDVIDSDYQTEVVQYVDDVPYYFDPVAVSAFGYRLKQAYEKDIDVTLVILLRGDEHCGKLGLMAVKQEAYDPDRLYAMDPDSQALTAFFRLIARRFGSGANGAKHFILGNEVNMPEAYNYTGTSDPYENADLYARTFVKFEHELTNEGNYNSRAYISLDHTWTVDGEKDEGIGGKEFLDLFHERVHELSRDCRWNVAYHLYAPNLKKTSSIWKNPELLTQEIDTPYIGPGNLSVLTGYLAETYTPDCRVLLSEQGYDIGEGEEIQAAGIALCYYEALTNPMVEAAIFRSYVDEGTDGGLDLGLVARNGKEREAFRVYQQMDGKRGLYIMAYYLARSKTTWK